MQQQYQLIWACWKDHLLYWNEMHFNAIDKMYVCTQTTHMNWINRRKCEFMESTE